ncbi:hypothetical protein ACQY0O_008033 [Thecaphora frezii]
MQIAAVPDNAKSSNDTKDDSNQPQPVVPGAPRSTDTRLGRSRASAVGMPQLAMGSPASKDRRKGWVYSSDDDAAAVRGNHGFSVKDSVAVWNKGLGPSKDSIPSRTSSLATEAPMEEEPSASDHRPELNSGSPSNPSAEAGPSRQTQGARAQVSSAPSDGADSPDKRFSRTYLAKLIGPGAFSDHQRIMAAAKSGRNGNPSRPSSAVNCPGSRQTQQSSMSNSERSSEAHSSVASYDGAGVSGSGRSSAESSEATSPPSSWAHGSGGVSEAKSGNVRVDHAIALTPVSGNVYRKTNASLLSLVKPMPPVVERFTTPVLSRPPIGPARNEKKAKPIAKNGLGKRADLRIELPPSRGYKSAYPAILVDTSHLNDDFMSQSFRDSEDDDSSWPSTPSTTPLEVYLSAPNAEREIAEVPVGPMSDGAVVRAAYLMEPSHSAIAPSEPQRPCSSLVAVTSAVTSHRDLGRGRPSLLFDVPAQRAPKPSHESPRRLVHSLLSRSLSTQVPPQPPTKLHGEASPSKSEVQFHQGADGARVQLRRNVGGSSSPEQPRSSEKRRSFELRPILLNALANQTRVSFVAPSPDRAGAPTARVHSGTNVGGLQYTRRWSEQSYMSSSASLAMAGRGSDASEETCTPSPRPSTTITVPSPNINSEHKQLAAAEAEADARPGSALFRKPPLDPYTPLPPSASRRYIHSVSHSASGAADLALGEAKSQGRMQRALLQDHVEKQKGRVVQDAEFIAEWVQVSARDLPQAAQAEIPYDNGGKGVFSNEPAGRRISSGRGRPWRVGRFSTSNVSLPANHAHPSGPPAAKRKISILRRPKAEGAASTIALVNASEGDLGRPSTGAKINNASKISMRVTSVSSSAAEQKPFVPNPGWTKANRNAAFQDLCQKKSIGALLAASLNVVSKDQRPVPASTVTPDQPASPLVASPAAQFGEGRRLIASDGTGSSQQDHATRSTPPGTKPGVYKALSSPDQQAFEPKFEVTDKVNTFKSIHPQVGHWCIEDLDEEDGSIDSGSEGGNIEIDINHGDTFGAGSPALHRPTNEGRRAAVSSRDEELQLSMLNVFFSSIRGAPDPNAFSDPSTSAPLQAIPGAHEADLGGEGCFAHLSQRMDQRNACMSSRGKEIRLSVQAPLADASNLAKGTMTVPVTWKAVKVAHLSDSSCQDLGYLASREKAKTRKTRAMSLEAQVQRGQFAGLVGLRSPKRRGREVEEDGMLARPSDRQDVDEANDEDDLFISKEGSTGFVVRRPGLCNNREEILEIVARAPPRRSQDRTATAAKDSCRDELPIRYSVDEENCANRDKLPGMPMFDLDRAFPSPLNMELARKRSFQDAKREAESSLSSSYDEWNNGEVVQMHVRRKGLHGVRASFDANDGRRWFWRTQEAPTTMMKMSSNVSCAPTSASGSVTGITGGSGLSGGDLELFALDGAEPVLLATYSADAAPAATPLAPSSPLSMHNALGLFKPRPKPAPAPFIANGEEERRPLHAMLPHTTPLGQLGPLVGIRGAKPIRTGAHHAHGGAAAGMRPNWVMQNRRAAMSTDDLIRPAALRTAESTGQQLHPPPPAAHSKAERRSMDASIRHIVPCTSMSAQEDGDVDAMVQGAEVEAEAEAGAAALLGPPKRMGDVQFLADCYNHDLATVTLLALLGMIKV